MIPQQLAPVLSALDIPRESIAWRVRRLAVKNRRMKVGEDAKDTRGLQAHVPGDGSIPSLLFLLASPDAL